MNAFQQIKALKASLQDCTGTLLAVYSEMSAGYPTISRDDILAQVYHSMTSGTALLIDLEPGVVIPDDLTRVKAVLYGNRRNMEELWGLLGYVGTKQMGFLQLPKTSEPFLTTKAEAHAQALLLQSCL